MSLKSHPVRKLAAGAAALALLGAAATSAQAANLTLQYKCEYPLIGDQPLAIAINASIPTSVPVGSPTGVFKITAVAVTGGQTTSGIQTLGAASLVGSAKAQATVSLPGGINLPVAVPISVPKYNVPAGSGNLTLNASGETPSLTFSQPGDAKITVDSISLSLSAYDVDGKLLALRSTGADSDGNPDTFDVTCTLNGAGQSTTLASFAITEAGTAPGVTPAPVVPPAPTPTKGNATTGVEYGYNLTGAANLKTLIKGSLPLKGNITAAISLPSGAFSGPLELAKTQAPLTALGFLPVTAFVQILPSGPVTGTLLGGKLTGVAKAKIRLSKVTVFGLQIAGGNTCQTDQATAISLKSTDKFFYPLSGGSLSGSFGIGSISNCGILTGLLSPLAGGSGNAIAMKLLPLA